MFRARLDSILLMTIGVTLSLWGCGDGSKSVDPRLQIPAVDAALPERLSNFGLYPKAPDLSVVGQGASSYDPEWPLWSDGGEKQRFVAVPAGSESDDAGMTLPDPANLPLGTLFFKTFSFAAADATTTAVSPVETRVMRLGSDGWEFARYQWNVEHTDAELLTTRHSVDVPVQVDGEFFNHKIPTELDCKTCHEASPARVLGYTDLQVFQRSIDAAPNEETEAVLGYVVGNCVNCHNGSNEEGAAYDLRPAVFLENTVNRATESSASGAGIRIVPGKPDESALLIALEGGNGDSGFKPMPPLGVQRIDQQGVERLRAWIENLPSWYEPTP